jgi:putative transposase
VPRAGRQNVAGGIYHVTARGNAQETIFRDELDYVALLRRLSTTAERYSWRCRSAELVQRDEHLLEVCRYAAVAVPFPDRRS